MPYQVTFNKAGGRGRGRTTDAYRLKPDAQRYADNLNSGVGGMGTTRRNARVVIAKKGTYDRIV